ncbi:MAG: PilZ domain-containing protein [Acidobacteria bacterium]|nr:PilZ domain-containing protein [Acidobacteriota bacterium]
MGNGLTALTSSAKKFSARAALVDLQESSKTLLSECFRQFGIDAVAMTVPESPRLSSEKFDACVVRMSPLAEAVLESVRGSRSNSRMVIYGLGGTLKDTMRLSKYGLNAVFHEPLERPAALKLVKATQMLVLHEFRRYVRIPVITEVSVAAGERHFTATSVELSSGGMSLKSPVELSHGTQVEISFALLTLPRIWVRGAVSWVKQPSKVIGVRFDPQDERRLRIKEWVDSYLEI